MKNIFLVATLLLSVTINAANTCGGTVAYTCPNGGTLSRTTCTVNTTTSAAGICPAGLTPDATTGTCSVNPTCPITTGFGASNFDGTNDLCWAVVVPDCSSSPGTTYDSASGKCIKTPNCNSGILDTAADVCYVAANNLCGTWPIDTINNVCYSNPTCLNGAYNTTANKCQAAITPDCNTYTWSATDNKCISSIVCPQDTSFSLSSTIGYSASLDKCVSQTQHDCLAGYIYNGLPILQCEAVPVCLGGVYNPVNDRCFDGNSCPVGNYPCVGTNNGKESWCSPYACSGMKCGTASCQSESSAAMGNKDPSKCSSLVCDVSQPYNEYCGSSTCVSGFGVYALNGKCYQDVCPSGSNQQGDGSCQQLKCPSGSKEVNGLCILN